MQLMLHHKVLARTIPHTLGSTMQLARQSLIRRPCYAPSASTAFVKQDSKQQMTPAHIKQWLLAKGIQASLALRPEQDLTADAHHIKSMVLLLLDPSGPSALQVPSPPITTDGAQPPSIGFANYNTVTTPGTSTGLPESSRTDDSAEKAAAAAATAAAAAASPAPTVEAAVVTPVLVVLLACQKVDLRAVARHLDQPRARLRLASPEEAEAVTGFELGSIPPLGHRTKLRTLVDAAVAGKQPHELLCAGAGASDTLLTLPVSQLLSATGAELGNFSITQHNTTAPQLQLHPAQQQQPHDETGSLQESVQQQLQQWKRPGGRQLQQQQQQQLVSEQAYHAQLPVPWAAGAEEVELVGVIAHRRRVAKLLLFASLVPESVPPLPTNGTAAYVRRLWRHPVTHVPCEVQLIMGKTIERQLGRDATAALFDRLKVGSVVLLTGRVQQNPAAAAAASKASTASPPAAAGGGAGSVTTGSAAPGQQCQHSQHADVLDVVVQHIRVLYKNRATLSRALQQAQRQGHTAVTSALQLDRLSSLTPEAEAPYEEEVAEDTFISSMTAQQQQQQAQIAATTAAASAAAERQLPPSVPAVPAPTAELWSVPDGLEAAAVVPKSQQHHLQQQEQQEHYQFPLPPSSIVLVQDLAGIRHMHQAILGQQHDRSTTNSTTNNSSSNMGAANPHRNIATASSSEGNGNGSCSSTGTRNSTDCGSSSSGNSNRSEGEVVVGIDCEWQPYKKGSPRSPVALLQLATRQQVFLVDMLALCAQREASSQQQERQLGNTSPSTLGVQECSEGQTQPSPQSSQGSPQGNGPVCDNGSSSSNSSSAKVSQAGAKLHCDATRSTSLTPEAAVLGRFLQELFSSNSIVKVGYQLSGDVRRLQQSYPQLCTPAVFQTSQLQVGSNCDLTHRKGDMPVDTSANAASNAVDADSATVVSTDDSSWVLGWRVRQQVDLLQVSQGIGGPVAAAASLSALVRTVLGKPMDKAQQTSNWAARPLSVEQMVYAANDAHVLTVLHDVLQQQRPTA